MGYLNGVIAEISSPYARCRMKVQMLVGRCQPEMRGQPRSPRRTRPASGAIVAIGTAIALLLTSCSTSRSATSTTKPERVTGGPAGAYLVPPGIHKVKHVIVIEQENRSFDSYFGTFPGADGIPMNDGTPTVCVPMPTGGCQRPYHDTADINGGGPHGEADAVADVDGGKMDGFIRSATDAKKGCGDINDPECSRTAEPGVMGYHTTAEIRNYWTYAKDFVLDDHMFEPVKSWSLPDHLYLVSGWSAKCSSPNPMSCKNQIRGPYTPLQMQNYARPSHRQRHCGSHQRLDRHHLAFVQPARAVGVLRADRRSARLRR